MARSKQIEERPMKDSANVQISIDDFIRTRDSVVTGLANLQSAVQDLSRAYIAHTNTVIGRGSGSSIDLLNLTMPLGVESTILGARFVTPGVVSDTGEIKKRKRAPHDKNAPKRPVTPYFLYMQTARSTIADEMEPGCSAKEVANEGTRRWNEMAPEERERWSYKYGINFARYKEKVKAYKAGRSIPEITDAEAKRLYEEQKSLDSVYEPYKGNHNHAEDLADTDSTDASSSSERHSPELPKARSPVKSSRASKRHHENREPHEKLSSYQHAPARESQSHDVDPTADQVSKSPELERRTKTRRKENGENAETSGLRSDVMVAIASSPKSSPDKTLKARKSKKKRKSS